MQCCAVIGGTVQVLGYCRWSNAVCVHYRNLNAVDLEDQKVNNRILGF
jgi:hypothetical protein